MKEIGMKYHITDGCPKYHIIYYGQHTLKTNFIKFNRNGYKTDQITKRFL